MLSCCRCSHNKDNLIQCLRTNEKLPWERFRQCPAGSPGRVPAFVISAEAARRALSHTSSTHAATPQFQGFFTLMTLGFWLQGCFQKTGLSGKLQQQGHGGWESAAHEGSGTTAAFHNPLL